MLSAALELGISRESAYADSLSMLVALHCADGEPTRAPGADRAVDSLFAVRAVRLAEQFWAQHGRSMAQLAGFQRACPSSQGSCSYRGSRINDPPYAGDRGLR